MITKETASAAGNSPIRKCSRDSCAEPATASCLYDPRAARAWLSTLEADQEIHPQAFLLCTFHADKLRVPNDWTLTDLRVVGDPQLATYLTSKTEPADVLDQPADAVASEAATAAAAAAAAAAGSTGSSSEPADEVESDLEVDSDPASEPDPVPGIATDPELDLGLTAELEVDSDPDAEPGFESDADPDATVDSDPTRHSNVIPIESAPKAEDDMPLLRRAFRSVT